MPAKKKSTKKRAHAGAVGLMNRNQRKQLEALGYVDKPKKKGKSKKR